MPNLQQTGLLAQAWQRAVEVEGIELLQDHARQCCGLLHKAPSPVPRSYGCTRKLVPHHVPLVAARTRPASSLYWWQSDASSKSQRCSTTLKAPPLGYNVCCSQGPKFQKPPCVPSLTPRRACLQPPGLPTVTVMGIPELSAHSLECLHAHRRWALARHDRPAPTDTTVAQELRHDRRGPRRAQDQGHLPLQLPE